MGSRVRIRMAAFFDILRFVRSDFDERGHGLKVN